MTFCSFLANFGMHAFGVASVPRRRSLRGPKPVSRPVRGFHSAIVHKAAGPVQRTGRASRIAGWITPPKPCQPSAFFGSEHSAATLPVVPVAQASSLHVFRNAGKMPALQD